MATIVLDNPDAVPMGNEPVYRDGKIVGKTTSAAFGYRVGKPIALGYLEGAIDGQSVEVDTGRTSFSGRVSLAPAFDPLGKRMRQSAQRSS